MVVTITANQIALGILTVGLATLVVWLYLKLKLKRQEKKIPGDVLAEYNEAVRRYEESGRQGDPYEIIYQVRGFAKESERARVSTANAGQSPVSSSSSEQSGDNIKQPDSNIPSTTANTESTTGNKLTNKANSRK